MYEYSPLKRDHGNKVSQTIDAPITIFDFWELSEAFSALLVILVCGVFFYCWGFMAFLLVVVLWIGPMIRRRNHRGIFFHWPYRHLWVSLPGLINPKGPRRYSD